MKQLFCTIMTISAFWAVWAQPVSEKAVRDYIDTYNAMAVKEMEAYKIPASITLAQAVYSSKAGTNRVAMEANNHFGITCHGSEWEGETFYETEDRSGDRCYRKYTNAGESYRDHSLFLVNRSRYAALFVLPATDYRGWARGLKEAGYAVNPRYADTLIAIIEKYNLTQYDVPAVPKTAAPAKEGDVVESEAKTEPEWDTGTETVTSSQENAAPEVKEEFPQIAPRTVDNVHVFVLNPSKVPFKQAYYPYTRRAVYENNKTKFLLAKAGDTYASLATSLQLTEKNLRLYNDVYDNSEPVEGEVIYVEMKSTKSPVDYHVLDEKDTYHYVSQLYGVQLKILVKRNSGTLKNYKSGDRICVGCK